MRCLPGSGLAVPSVRIGPGDGETYNRLPLRGSSMATLRQEAFRQSIGNVEAPIKHGIPGSHFVRLPGH